MKHIDREVQSTLCAISTTSSLVNLTGSWRFAKPQFVDRESPCYRQCPAGEDIAAYMYLAAQGRFEEAWRVIMETNPFPAIMGRVCYHTCEGGCNRREHDEAVAIHEVERFIGDYGLERGLQVQPGPALSQKEVGIVGAGPAGLSAAYHLRRLGYRVVVYEAQELLGGLLRHGIPSYRLPKGIVEGEIGRLYGLGIAFQTGVRIGVDVPWEELERRHGELFIAIGAHQETDPSIPGTKREGVFRGLSFLEAVNLGRGPAVGKVTVVVGGGNSALDCARAARRLGAEVTVVYRRTEAEMPAYEEEVQAARQEGVKFVFLAGPEEIIGDRRITGIRLSRMRLEEPDASGRRRPVTTGETFDLACDSVILAIGESVSMEDLPSMFSKGGRWLEADHEGATGKPGFFAGGDVLDIPHTVTHAIASGRRAAFALDRLFGRGQGAAVLKKNQGPFRRRNPAEEAVFFDGLNPFYFDRRPRTKTLHLSAPERVRDFRETVLAFSEEEAVAEARRCFVCGSCTECGNCQIFCPDLSVKRDTAGFGYVIDLDYCKGCGVCVRECPRGAMKMVYME